MKIAVLGASGALGSAVIVKARAAGHIVVGVSRQAPANVPAGATHVAADVTTSGG